MEKMMVAVLLLLFVSLGHTGAHSDFHKLPEIHKKGVEVVLKQVNSVPGVQNHFLFFKSLEKSSLDAGFGVQFLYHHFQLKATRCRKGTADATYSKCAFRNDRPLIDCGICYKTYHDAIEEEPKPYIHCVHKPTLTKEMISARTEHCNKMSYSSGSASILLVKGTQ